MFIIQQPVRCFLLAVHYPCPLDFFLIDETDSKRQQQLGANPAFDFGSYDAEHDAQTSSRPAWLKARWYRQLVTPEQTPLLSASQVVSILAPFAVTTPMPPVHTSTPEVHSPVSSGNQYPQSTEESGYVNPFDILLPNHPMRRLRSLAHARIGLRAQRRYGILPELWQARWA